MNSSASISITNGRIIDPANGIDAILDLHISDGEILDLGASPEGFQPDLTVDATGLVVCPGLIDLSARMREPGHEYKATLQSETQAAVRGGITTLCYPPDTDPVIDTPAMATLVRKRAQRIGNARVLPVGALSRNLAGDQLSEMATLQQAGCVALGNADRPLANTLVERRAQEYAATFGILVMLRSEDLHLRNSGCAHEGPVASRLGLPGIPEAAESVAVARDLALAEHTGCRIHFRGLSCGTAVKKLALAQHQQLQVSADVAAHQLHLTEMDLEGFDSNCHVNPPLRSLADRQALREGVAKGTISAICSDHQPHDADAKEAPFPSTAPGISGLDTLLALSLKLVDEGVLGLPEAIARVTCGPADILGVELGRLSRGYSADICIFDPDRHWELNQEEMLSAGHNTPFLGWEFRGRVIHTLFEGRLVFSESNELTI
ncbi:MAG: dihydroorotase [Gammaproteobacteria bacterium]|nr:dihydroorotase [Gammaproteobacteria bacterium]